MTGTGRSLADWLAFQQRLHPRSIELGLERVRVVAHRLGLLPPAGSSIIVGGTNGKGSTATTVAALLTAAGRRTGLFTSPHLVRYHERMSVDGRMPEDSALMAAFEQIEAARDDTSLTFFEWNTLAALLWFRDQRVECIVLEVGLGGRLDATNIVDADVAVLCSVALDHTEWLGNTLEEIGREKAGIFRRDQQVVLATADMPASVYQEAERLRCRLSVSGRDFDWQVAADGGWIFRDRYGAEPLPALSLPGAIQHRNAAAALAAVRMLPHHHSITQSLATGLRAVRLDGRLQRIPGAVEWLLDVAHNEAAATQLAAALDALPPAHRQIAVFGMLEDKNVAAVVARVASRIDHWIFCGIGAERGLTAAALRQRAGDLQRATSELADDVPAGCARAVSMATPGDRILAFGSFHTVGPALQWHGLY